MVWRCADWLGSIIEGSTADLQSSFGAVTPGVHQARAQRTCVLLPATCPPATSSAPVIQHAFVLLRISTRTLSCMQPAPDNVPALDAICMTAASTTSAIMFT